MSVPTNASKKSNLASSRSAKSTFIQKKKVNKKLKKFKIHLSKSQLERVSLVMLKNLLKSTKSRISEKILDYIICGGSYKHLPHVKNYEVHHLISARFAKEHPNVISVKDCPAVLIPRALHIHTGSYGSRSPNYVKQETTIFSKKKKQTGSNTAALAAVLEYGTKDLINTINSHTPLNITKSDISSPYIKAQRAIYDRPNATPSHGPCNNSVQTPTCTPYRSGLDCPLDAPKSDIDCYCTSMPKENINDRTPDHVSTPKSSSYNYSKETDFVLSTPTCSNNTYNPTVPYNCTNSNNSSCTFTHPAEDNH